MNARLRLLLIRHAQARGGLPGQRDASRALSRHGRAQAATLGQRCAALGWCPSHILHSPAKRADQTARLFQAQLSPCPRLWVVPALYPGSPASILQAILAHAAAADTLAVIAHNPAISLLIAQLCPGRQVDMPPAAAALIACDIEGTALRAYDSRLLLPL